VWDERNKNERGKVDGNRSKTEKENIEVY